MKAKQYRIYKRMMLHSWESSELQIHCVCLDFVRAFKELVRLRDCKWIGYESGERYFINPTTLCVETPDGYVVYQIQEYEVVHRIVRPRVVYKVMPKNGKAMDAHSYSNYGDALEEKIRLERLTGERYIIVK